MFTHAVTASQALPGMSVVCGKQALCSKILRRGGRKSGRGVEGDSPPQQAIHCIDIEIALNLFRLTRADLPFFA